MMAPSPVLPNSVKPTPAGPESTPSRRVAQLTEHLVPSGGIEQAGAQTATPTPYPSSKLKLDPTRCIDHIRKVSVAVIGAGISGINAGILLPAKVPGIELTIFEKNNDVVSVLRHSSHE
jgi:hypothetical protein